MNTSSSAPRRSLSLSTVGRTFLVLAATLGVAYSALLVSTVQAVSDRRELRDEIRAMRADVATLELHYYEQVHALGGTSLDQFGYKEATPRFVTADGTRTGSDVAMVTR